MTSKTCYPKLLWSMLVKKCWYGAAAFLTLFMSMPLTAMLSFENVEEYKKYENAFWQIEYQQTRFAEFIGGCSAWIWILVGGLALLGAWSGLAWLHSKRQMDLYGSLPVKREVFYGAECLSTILWFLGCYVVNLLMTLVVGAQKGVLSSLGWKVGLGSIGVYFLGFLAFYFCAALAMVLTGKILTGILGTGVILGIVPLTILLISTLTDVFFFSYVADSEVWMHVLKYSSPIVSCLLIGEEINSYVNAYTNTYLSIAPVISLLVWSAAGALVSVALLKIRPAEGAEQSMVFSKTEGTVKGILLYPVAIGGGLFFWGIAGEQSYGWLWFGLFFTSLIVSVLIEIVYYQDRKRIFSHMWSTGISVCMAVLTILGVRFDIFGVDSWIPEKDEVEHMVLLGSYENYFRYPDGSYGSETYLRKNLNNISGMEIYDYLEEGLELLELYRDIQNGDSEAEASFEANGWPREITILFQMKNGSVKERRYRLSESSLYALEEKLYAYEIYREAWLPLIITEDDQYQLCSMDYIWENKEISCSGWNDVQQLEFVNIYKEELRTLSYEQIFGTEEKWAYLDFESKDGNWLSGEYPLNENFVNTLAYIDTVEEELSKTDDLSE